MEIGETRQIKTRVHTHDQADDYGQIVWVVQLPPDVLGDWEMHIFAAEAVARAYADPLCCEVEAVDWQAQVDAIKRGEVFR